MVLEATASVEVTRVETLVDWKTTVDCPDETFAKVEEQVVVRVLMLPYYRCAAGLRIACAPAAVLAAAEEEEELYSCDRP